MGRTSASRYLRRINSARWVGWVGSYIEKGSKLYSELSREAHIDVWAGIVQRNVSQLNFDLRSGLHTTRYGFTLKRGPTLYSRVWKAVQLPSLVRTGVGLVGLSSRAFRSRGTQLFYKKVVSTGRCDDKWRMRTPYSYGHRRVAK